MSFYVVSDLHGYNEVFQRGLEQIGFTDSDELCVIGDAIDRGPDGVEILRCIKDHGNMDLIIGNHEFMMLNAVDPDGDAKCNGMDSELWLYYNGGTETFAKYRKLSDPDRREMLFWLNRRRVIKTVRVGDKTFCLTHSFYIPEYENMIYSELSYGTVWDIVWKSMFRNDETRCPDIYAEYPDYMFITGHVPVQRIRRESIGDPDFNRLQSYGYRNFLDIDGGCAFGSNPLLENGAIFVRLDDMKTFSVRM